MGQKLVEKRKVQSYLREAITKAKEKYNFCARAMQVLFHAANLKEKMELASPIILPLLLDLG